MSSKRTPYWGSAKVVSLRDGDGWKATPVVNLELRTVERLLKANMRTRAKWAEALAATTSLLASDDVVDGRDECEKHVTFVMGMLKALDTKRKTLADEIARRELKVVPGPFEEEDDAEDE